jgi:hypothetical protein
MAVKPVISLYVPSIRPENWPKQLASLKQSTVPFEVIYVGHVPPIEGKNYPPELQYIHSAVKPAQCAEIGFRACEGEFCIFAQDDVIFGPNTLDILHAAFLKQGTDLSVVSCMPYLNGSPLETARYRFWDGDRGSPMTPIGGLYKRSVLVELGGIDKNFVCTAWDIDLCMRLFERGGFGVFCEGTIANEVVPPNSTRLCSYGARIDRPLLHTLWTMTHGEYAHQKNIPIHYLNPGRKPNGVICKNRRRPFEPFSPIDLLVKSQGPTGRWQ